MTSDKDNAYQTVAVLTERFEEQLQFYKKADYNETLVRRDFIDPFFKAWVGILIIHKAMQKLTGK